MRKIKGLRWYMIGLVTLGTVLGYLTRNTIAVAAPTLMSELHITTQQYSYIIAAYSACYTLMQPVAGYVLDLLGTKVGYAVFAIMWAIFCAATAMAGSWGGLALARGAVGAAEAAMIPAGLKASSEWFPAKERSVAVGYFNVGSSIGAMLAPPIIYFAHASFGWQGAFMFTGVLALLWVILWWIFYHNPEQHPNLSRDELAFIKQDNEPAPVRLPFLTALKTVSKNKRFYGIAIPAFMAEPAWAVLSFWVPLYLAKEHGMDLKQIAMFAWLPFLAADLGSVASGYLTRLYTRWFGCTRVNSVVASSVTGAFLMISLAVVAVTRDPYITIVLISIGGFGHQIISCMLSALVVESFDKGQMATVNGMRGSAAWIASFLFSLLIGVTADKIGFNPLFIAMGFFDLIGAVFLVMLVAERRQRPANP